VGQGAWILSLPARLILVSASDTWVPYHAGMAPPISPRQRAALKARAHALEPVVQLGQAGASDAVVTEVDRALSAHGLIKVKLAGSGREQRDALAGALSTRTDAAVVQQVGRVLVLWRPRPDDEPIDPAEYRNKMPP
jgi:RNA-binding protein